MGEILIDEPDLIIDDPAGDCVDYWTALVKEDKTNNNILQSEKIVQVILFEKNTGYKKQPKEKKNELRKKIKNILQNSTFPPEQIRKAIEGYVQDPSLMDMRVDQVDPSSVFLFDVCSENFSTAFEFERKGMLQPIEDIEFDWQTFQDCKELNLLSKHQDDFEPGEVDDEEEAPRRKFCRTERYESPEKPKRKQDVRESTKSRYQDRRQDEQTKENDREKDRDRDRERERRNSPEKKRLVKLKDQKDEEEEKGLTRRKERKPSRERDNEKEKFRQREKDNKRDRDKSDKDQSRDKERDRSRERVHHKRSSSKERRDEDRDRQTFRYGRKEQEQGLTRGSKGLRPYDNQAQRDNRDDRENGNNKNDYQGRMNKSYNENQRNTIIDIDGKESKEKNNHRSHYDDPRTNKVMVIDDQDRHERRYSSKNVSYNNNKPRQFDHDRRNNYQENSFNNQSQDPNEMGKLFMQMMTVMVNQFTSNPNMANMMGQFTNSGNRGGFPNRYQQKPYFHNNNNKRYQNNYNNDRGGFQLKPFYSGNDENDRRRKRSNSDERNKTEKRNDNREKENHRNHYDNNNNQVTEATRRRNY